MEWVIFLTISFILLPPSGYTQETNCQVSGIIKSEKNELLGGATIIVIHEPTKNTYTSISRNNGHFTIANLKPGGPYSIIISYTGYETIKKENLFLSLNSFNNFLDLSNNEAVDFFLKDKSQVLQEVVTRNTISRPGAETSINLQQLSTLPSISRNLQDFVRLVPQANVNGDGMMSLDGQNNKFNAFFIDGSNNNDILGISMSGTNGGQTNTPPISIEALDEIKVLLAPYDVQYSNFTGGSINAITKSGSNEFKGSAWYYFRNENMAGRSPLPIPDPGSPGEFTRPKQSPFFNQTFGNWVSGPLLKNKLFYFISIEKQIEKRPQLFNFSEYKGTSTAGQLNILADSLRKKYNYEPGSFLETQEKVNATRTIFKFDWNPSLTNKFTFSYRYNLAERTATRSTGSTAIAFQNNAFLVPVRTHAFSLEWKRFFKKNHTNRFLFTYTHEKDDRQPLGEPFPQVSIADGAGRIFFGSHAVSQFNLFKAREMTLLDIFKFIKGKNNISIGTDINFTKIEDLIIPSYFGTYQFRNLNDFLASRFPSRYIRSYPIGGVTEDENNTTAGAKYVTRRFGFFVNDEISLNENLKLNIGIRIDGNALPRSYAVDDFFNDTASHIIAGFYDLEGAKSGKTMQTYYQPAPRISLTYRIPHQKLTLQGGAGLFSGRILNLWATNIYNSTLANININPQNFGLNFIGNPNAQPTYETLGLNAATARGEPVLVAKHFKYPTVFRSSLSAEKQLNNGWAFTLEALFTKNIHEWKITNVNLLPPANKSASPGSRFVYSSNGSAELIPLLPNGGNPYSAIYLLSNNPENKGFAYSFSALLNKAFSHHFSLTAAYTYGKSIALFEPYSTAGPIEDQWAQSETVNGKNSTRLSNSDLDPGHRLYITAYKKFNYSKNNIATSVCLFYNGQSGRPYSYVYNGSLINDNGETNFDLLYIPTHADLDNMTFIPNTVGGVTYTGQQQKELLDNFIETDKYLAKHRGSFAERNGAKLPFIHTLDLRIQQDFNIRWHRKISTVSIIYDVFNFTNLLNKNWGRTYSLSFDNYSLITFAGFANQSPLTPQYQFTPFAGKPYSIQTSTAPGNSARWTSQLGIKVCF